MSPTSTVELGFVPLIVRSIRCRDYLRELEIGTQKPFPMIALCTEHSDGQRVNLVKLGQTDLWLVFSTVGSGTVLCYSPSTYCYRQTLF
jgi:hypothetical protein